MHFQFFCIFLFLLITTASLTTAFSTINPVMILFPPGHVHYAKRLPLKGMNIQYLPQAPRRQLFLTQAAANDDSKFFNREREIRTLTTLFQNQPVFVVLLGLPSTGKTRLVNRVVSQVQARKGFFSFLPARPMFRPLFLNLRGVTITNGIELLEYLHLCSLESAIEDGSWKPFANELQAAIRKFKIVGSWKLGSTTATLAAESAKPVECSRPRHHILDDLVKALPNWENSKQKPFVLVVDEASRLMTLAQSDPTVRFDISSIPHPLSCQA
jgi:Cdc6-like AAA superfamily ATPase